MTEEAASERRLAEVEAALAGQEALRRLLPAGQADQVIARLVAEKEILLARVTGGGAVAQGTGAVAATTGGIAVGGNMTIHTAPVKPGPSDTTLREAYLSSVLEETGFLDLSGIDPAVANDRNVRLSLHAVYTALLTLSPRDPGEMGKTLRPERESRPVSALEQMNRHARLVLLGDPGSGKSTFVNFVALCMAGEMLGRPEANLELLTSALPGEDREGSENPQPWDHGKLFPVRVVLRDFAARGLLKAGEPAEAEHLWRYLEGELDRLKLPEVFPLLRDELLGGRGLVFLDGLDEVPEAERRRQQIRQAVEKFSAGLRASRVVLTSRTYAYQNPVWQVPGFERAVLAPFSRRQVDRFVGLWYEQMAVQGRLREDDARGRAERLRRTIFASDRLQGLAERPLLLTLMASLHAWKSGILPERREELYSEAVELLLNTWERRRLDYEETGSPVLVQASLAEWLKVDRQEVREVVEAAAFEAHGSQPGVEDTADIEEGKLVGRLLRLSRSPGANAVELKAYLSDRAGLLVERGEGVFTFPHRTFQEYLAACHLTARNYPKSVACLGREDPSRWREVVLLAGAKAARGAQSSVWRLADVLCFREPGGPGTVPGDDWGALIAGLALSESANLGQVDEEDEPKLERVRRWLMHLLGRDDFPVRDRAAAGQALAALGDPRFDVALWSLPAEPELGFVEIPASPFFMGSEKESDPGSFEDERPRHEVELPTFWMGRYPVTVGQFRSFVKESGFEVGDLRCLEGPLNHPVVSVTWKEALAYCGWLDARLKELAQTKGGDGFWSGLRGGALRFSLPSEAEWEKAARGPDGRIYPWGNDVDPNRTSFDGTGLFGTSTVGCFPGGISIYGCAEMSGNVWEWTRSLWGRDVSEPHFAYPYERQDGREHMSASTQVLRIARGGAFNHASRHVRSAFRLRYYPDFRLYYLGFRVVLSRLPL